MKGFVLAAGFGQRMLPITETLPKPLLPIAGMPLIAYSLALLKRAGITEVIINVHHLARTLMDAVGDGAAWGMRITYSHEAELLGTGGGLKKMHEALDSTFVVINSDIVVDLDLEEVLRYHREHQALATLVLREPEPELAHVGRIGIDRQHRVAEILGQAGPSGWPVQRSLMFTGVHVVEPKLLDYVPHNVHSDIIRYGYMKALANQETLMGFVSERYWSDAGTPKSYWATNEALLTEPTRLAHVAPLQAYALRPRHQVARAVCMGEGVHLGAKAELRPPVLLGESAKVGDGVRLGPLVTLGDHVSVGRGATLQNTVVLAGARVGQNASLDHMLVGPHSTLSLAPPPEPAPER